MGLDTTHDCWHGPYSAFHRFRVAIAEKVGIDLESMEGFTRATFNRFKGEYDPAKPGTRWDLLQPDPLWILLSHSDCDGSIMPKDCRAIAKRLREIEPLFVPREGGHPDSEDGKPMPERAIYDGVGEALNRFATGLELAAKKRQRVGFH